MTPPPFDAEAHARAVAATIGLPLQPEHLPGVVQNLQVAERMARLIETLPLTPADEPAPVFIPAREAP